MFNLILAASAATAALPTPEQCQTAALDPEAVLAQSIGLQGFVYGYPMVDLLKQKHNETHRVRGDQPVAAPVNRIANYPGVLTPATQGQLRAPNADTLYLNGWFDLSNGPVLLDVPAFGARYYTLAFMDLYARPHHLGTRTNGGRAMRYALVGPAGGVVPEGYEPMRLPTDIAWMLGRVLVTDKADEKSAIALSRKIKVTGTPGPDVTEAQPLKPLDSLTFFALLNSALRTLPPVAGEEGLSAQFDAGGFGPGVIFDADKLPPAQAIGLGCALSIGPQVLAKRGFRPVPGKNAWLQSGKMADPGRDYLLRAEVARGGYVNDPNESIYPAAVMDTDGALLNGAHRYRLKFGPGRMPPVDAFWSLTAYDSKTAQLTENPIRRYAIGDRTRGLLRGKDGSLEIILSATRPPEGLHNWLPVPTGAFHLVARLYLPRAEALDGRYALPPVERIDVEKGSVK